MSTLIATVFHDQSTAFEMRAALAKMQDQYLIETDDAAVVTRDGKGEIRLHQATSLTGTSAGGGAFWGMLIGLLFSAPFLRSATGAGAGALSGKLSDIGMDDRMAKPLGDELRPNSSVLIVILRRATADKVLDGLKQFAGRGRVFLSLLNKDGENSLREVLESRGETKAA
jgi:uncharacterized membrane protein